ncbi:diadenylate cyclase [Desulfitispora alkaliphila]|uniref:diadenylate cyclase CdaA n=1 Tax=Desulfitispora alkaliphila TaxID=622674 RepID=UPI003D1AF584
MFSQLIYLKNNPAMIIVNIIDILIVAFVIYKLMMLIKGTKAVQLIKGLVVLLIASTFSSQLGLNTIDWLLNNIWTMLFVALPVVFQPELRRALEQLGRGKFFVKPYKLMNKEDISDLVDELTRAVQVLAKNNTGALIVIERETGLGDLADSGTKLDAAVSAELLVNLFEPKSPLHDGAVVLRGDRISVAGAFLPLAESVSVSRALGTRHRAAVGITEQSDAIAVVVSEETGIISIANEGQLSRYIEIDTLKELLIGFMSESKSSIFERGRRK